MAFLDDLYVITSRERALEAYHTVADAVRDIAGVQSHLGKLVAWSPAGGPPPEGLHEFCPTAWRGNRAPEENGVIILSAPLGTPDPLAAHAAKRLGEERKLLEHLPWLGDVQSAWAILLYCAVPRANHFLRGVPPSLLGESSFVSGAGAEPLVVRGGWRGSVASHAWVSGPAFNVQAMEAHALSCPDRCNIGGICHPALAQAERRSL